MLCNGGDKFALPDLDYTEGSDQIFCNYNGVSQVIKCNILKDTVLMIKQKL